MANAKKNRSDKYDEKLAINGSFDDVIGASVSMDKPVLTDFQQACMFYSGWLRRADKAVNSLAKVNTNADLINEVKKSRYN